MVPGKRENKLDTGITVNNKTCRMQTAGELEVGETLLVTADALVYSGGSR